MIILIWEQHGYLVPVVIFVSCLGMEYGVEWCFNDSSYYQNEAWPFTLALAIAGAVCRIAGLRLNRRGKEQPFAGPGVRIDGQEAQPPPPKVASSFFWVRIETWGYVLFAGALVNLLIHYLP